MRSRDFRLVMLGAAAILAAALPASACPEWKIAPVDSAWAPRVWIEARSPVTYGSGGIDVSVRGVDTLEVWASYGLGWGPWRFEILALHNGIVDTVVQEIGLTTADSNAWIRNRWWPVWGDSGIVMSRDADGNVIAESVAWNPFWSNLDSRWLDSLGWARGAIVFEAGQYKNTWPTTHRVGWIAFRSITPEHRSQLWIHVDRPPGGRQRTWLDASGEPMWIEMDCPSGALFRRWLRSNPPGYVGADTLSHFSSFLAGQPP